MTDIPPILHSTSTVVNFQIWIDTGDIAGIRSLGFKVNRSKDIERNITYYDFSINVYLLVFTIEIIIRTNKNE